MRMRTLITILCLLCALLLTASPFMSTGLELRPVPEATRALQVEQGQFQVKTQQQSGKHMRILALFSGTRNELGLDHRLGKQVLKLAVSRAKQLHPELGEVELVIQADDTECTSLNEIPSRVAEQFYGSEDAKQQCSSSIITGADQDLNCNSNETARILLRRQSAIQQQQHLSSAINTNLRQVSSSIDAIIGPSCDHLVDLIARMAAYWRTPIYSVASVGAAFGRKEIYSTLTRLSPSIDHLTTFVVKTMERFKWRHMAIIIDRRQVENRILLENLEKTINKLRYSIPIERKVIEFKQQQQQQQVGGERNGTTETSIEINSLCSMEAKTILLEARRVARVFLFLISDHQLIRRLLLCANELKMANGEFVFLAIDMGLKSSEVSSLDPTAEAALSQDGGQQQEMMGASGGDRPTSGRSMSSRAAQTLDWYLANDERNNMIAKKIFESLLVFSVELPISDEFNLFVEQTLDMAQQEFPKSRFERSSVGPLAVALHDSLLLAAEAHVRARKPQSISRNFSLEMAGKKLDQQQEAEGDDDEIEDWRPSREPALMWNERYSGGLIANMHINSNGDQELDYVLSDLEPEMGLMRPVARYARETRQIEPLPGSYIHWPWRADTPGEKPPPDEPECGFNDDAERCIDRQNLYAALSIVLALIILVLASVFVSLRKYRNIKYQMQLDDYWWKINWLDLQFIQATDSLASSNPQSIARALRSGGSVVSSQDGGSVISISTRATKHRRPPHPTQKATSGKQSAQNDPNSKRQSAAVPLIVTSNTETGETSDKNSAGTVSESGGGNKSIVALSLKGSELSPSGIFIRSDYSSVVRASNLAMYKNELVIVKQLNHSSNIEVSRDLLVDLRSMREHLHENLARFVGLCVEPERLAIVYEYCSRGSLQDMLLNESIAIDWTLKCSIIGDILNGLNFIHTTLLNFHGRLKSTNLVLDSRFTVKITDFGLQNLYSQLEALEDKGDDNESDDYGEEFEAGNEEDRMKHELQRDTLSLSVSQRAIGGPNPRRSSSSKHERSGVSHKRLKLKNKGSARHFWTAPEHLRAKDLHCSGSKKGDVYSLAIILFELLTRREPYHYGTNAKPHWPTIKRERRETAASQQPRLSCQQHLSVSGLAARPSMVSSTMVSSIGRRAQSKLRRISAAVAPAQDPSGANADTVSIISEQSGHSLGSVKSQIQTSGEIPEPAGGDHKSPQAKHHSRKQRNLRTSVVAIGEEGPISEVDEGTELGGDSKQSSTGVGGNAAQNATEELIDADEILDQLRMGLHPEPVRPHMPNFVLHEVNPKLVELMRECWQESPMARPTLVQIRNQMRKITKGMASRNYLDNLLERLQNYAADLERIVDAKSGDIVEEKFRTEELLYQLVPKFVAERLKNNEPIVPQVFDGVTILFSDIIGFEKYASVMSPSDLVDLLNSIYSSFESVITSFDVTKIETIIDQFLIASGISLEQHLQPGNAIVATQQQQQQQQRVNTTPGNQQPQAENIEQQQSPSGITKSRRAKLLGSLRHSHGSSDNKNQSLDIVSPGNQQQQDQQDNVLDRSYYRRSSAEQIARMALCLRDQMKSFYFRGSSSSDAQGSDGPRVTKSMATNFNIRIGIHSGNVCAGIVGVKRPKFCLIGDTVNVASRMHTNSKANKIQISADTKELLGQVPGFTIEPRGRIEVKGKGMMDTYWLESSF